jgi:hypothetical protein
MVCGIKTEKKGFSSVEPVVFVLSNQSNQTIFFQLFRGLPFHVRLWKKEGKKIVEAHIRFQVLKRPVNAFSVQSLLPNQEFRFLLNNREQFESLLLSETNDPTEAIGAFQLEVWIGSGKKESEKEKQSTIPELGYSTELKPPFFKLKTDWFSIQKK